MARSAASALRRAASGSAPGLGSNQSALSEMPTRPRCSSRKQRLGGGRGRARGTAPRRVCGAGGGWLGTHPQPPTPTCSQPDVQAHATAQQRTRSTHTARVQGARSKPPPPPVQVVGARVGQQHVVAHYVDLPAGVHRPPRRVLAAAVVAQHARAHRVHKRDPVLDPGGAAGAGPGPGRGRRAGARGAKGLGAGGARQRGGAEHG